MDPEFEQKPYNEAKIKLVLCLASWIGNSYYFTSIFQLRPPGRLSFQLLIGARLNENLNALTEDYSNYDAIFLTEWDHQFKQDTLEILWNTNKAVTSALYRSRTQRDYAFMVGSESKSLKGGLDYTDFPKDKPFTTGWTGLGAMLIRKEVFDCLNKPFFDPVKKGIDRDFCTKLRKHKIDIWINPMARIGHFVYKMI